jgi:hypothetical protein
MKRIKVKNYRVITLSLLLGLSVVGLSLMLARPPAVKAATLTVTSGADSGGTCPGADCTLRQAILVEHRNQQESYPVEDKVGNDVQRQSPASTNKAAS